MPTSSSACTGVGSALKTAGRENVPHDLKVFSMVLNINLIGTFNGETVRLDGAIRMRPR